MTTIIFGEVDVLAPKTPLIQWVGAATALVGLSLVIVAACLVLLENAGVKRLLRRELDDLPDLSEDATSGATKLAA